jgi:hypothetical protein
MDKVPTEELREDKKEGSNCPHHENISNPPAVTTHRASQKAPAA